VAVGVSVIGGKNMSTIAKKYKLYPSKPFFYLLILTLRQVYL
jgi:hypothetical protein